MHSDDDQIKQYFFERLKNELTCTIFLFIQLNTNGFGFALGLTTLNVVTFVYDVLTFPIYLLLQNPIRTRSLAKKKRAVAISQDENSITFRSLEKRSNFHEEIIRENIKTIAEVLEYCSKKYDEKRCLGTRQILSEDDETQPNGRVFKKYRMGDYQWITYAELDRLATNFGRGLLELGREPKTKVVIFGETRAEWMVAAHGIFKQSLTLVTIYATLGEEGIVHALNETEVPLVITTMELLPKIKKLLPLLPQIRIIVCIEDQLKSLPSPEDDSEGVKVVSYQHVLALGAKSNFGDHLPSQEDTAIIMYTSGSTGVPKGVIILHKNLIATFRGFCDSTKLYDSDIMMGFLPLAHVFELLVENVILFMGVRIGYSNALTMLDSSSKVMNGCPGDATVLRPTFITAVPLILDRIAKAVQDKVSRAGFLTRLLFNFAYRYKLRWTKCYFGTPLLDSLIFKSVGRILGGRVRLIVSGGAPLTSETQELVKTCFCLKLLQGYGLTETTSSATVQDIYDNTYSRVGATMTGTDMRLVNWEEGNYTVKDKPYPRGEIVLGGDCITFGYFKQDEETNNDFFMSNDKRWFSTGDIGEVQGDGVLKIIDRKKDLVKLQMGEYISLGKIESVLKMCPLVDTICIFADSSQNYCVTLLVGQREAITELAQKNGITSKNYEELCDNSTVIKKVLDTLAAFGKQAKLEKYEIPAVVTLVKEIWTPENGLLTSTFKLKRKIIQEKYKEEIKLMYTGR